MNIAGFLIIIHATTGGIALISGAFAIASRKGKSVHRTGGQDECNYY